MYSSCGIITTYELICDASLYYFLPLLWLQRSDFYHQYVYLCHCFPYEKQITVGQIWCYCNAHKLFMFYLKCWQTPFQNKRKLLLFSVNKWRGTRECVTFFGLSSRSPSQRNLQYSSIKTSQQQLKCHFSPHVPLTHAQLKSV